MKVKNSGNKASATLFFNKAIKTVDKLFRSSAFYNFFHSYSNSEKRFQNSFCYNIFNKSSFAAKRRIFKNNFARQCESSVLVNAISAFHKGILACKIRAFAVILMCFSSYSLIIGIMKYALKYTATPITESNFFSVLIFVVSLIFLPVRSSIPEFASNSRIISFLKNSFFVDDKNECSYVYNKAYMPPLGTLFIIGSVLGLLSLFFSIKSIIFFAICFFILLSFFKTPENGLPFLMLILPFCSITELCLFSVIALAAYLYKLLRGKRSFSFKYFDLLLFLFAIVIFSATYGSASIEKPSIDAVIMLVLVLMYFLARNCVKTELMLNKIFNSMSFASAAVSFSYIVSKVLSTNAKFIPVLESKLTFNCFFHEAFSNDIAMGEFILILIPIIFTTFAGANTNSKKTFSFIALLLSISAIIMTQSKGIIAALFICILVYIAASFRSPITSLVTVVIVCIALSLFITSSAFLGNDRFFFVNDYKGSIWLTSSKIISDNYISGIGFGKQNFSDIFAIYNKFSNINVGDCYNWYIQLFSQIGVFGFLFYAYTSLEYFKMQFTLLSETRYKNVFFSLTTISAISAMFSMYIRGITSYIWNEPKVFFVFFIIVGLSTSIYHINSDKKLLYETEI